MTNKVKKDTTNTNTNTNTIGTSPIIGGVNTTRGTRSTSKTSRQNRTSTTGSKSNLGDNLPSKYRVPLTKLSENKSDEDPLSSSLEKKLRNQTIQPLLIATGALVVRDYSNNSNNSNNNNGNINSNSNNNNNSNIGGNGSNDNSNLNGNGNGLSGITTTKRDIGNSYQLMQDYEDIDEIEYQRHQLLRQKSKEAALKQKREKKYQRQQKRRQQQNANINKNKRDSNNSNNSNNSSNSSRNLMDTPIQSATDLSFTNWMKEHPDGKPEHSMSDSRIIGYELSEDTMSGQDGLIHQMSGVSMDLYKMEFSSSEGMHSPPSPSTSGNAQLSPVGDKLMGFEFELNELKDASNDDDDDDDSQSESDSGTVKQIIG